MRGISEGSVAPVLARPAHSLLFMKTRSLAALGSAFVLGLSLLACSGGTGGTGVPVTEGEVTSQSGLTISTTIIAVTLGDDCPAAQADALCAAPTDSSSEQKASGDSARGGCGGGCQQSNVQISFATTAGNGNARIEIASVTLHEAATGNLVDTLAARDPRAWNGGSYASWDQSLKPSSETKASYNLTAPKWGTVGNSYSQKYKLRVTVRIDGAASITLESQTLNRQATFDT